jgi:hypothetical protein
LDRVHVHESGRFEVLVQSFPEAGARTQISTSGGTEPVWSRDGRELFYLDGDAMKAVDVRTSPTFSAGAPRKLFEGRYAFISSIRLAFISPCRRSEGSLMARGSRHSSRASVRFELMS